MLREAREAKGITLRELAATLGISRPFLSLVERGKSKLPPDRIRSFAEALDLSVDDLWIRHGPIPDELLAALRRPAFRRIVTALVAAEA